MKLLPLWNNSCSECEDSMKNNIFYCGIMSAPITSTLCRIIFFLTALYFPSTPAHAQTNLVPDNVEFAVLKALYDSTGGSSWTNKGGWPATGSWPASATAAQMDGWQGVTVTNGDITNLNLNNRNMTGKLPAAIGDLTSLTVLTFSSNRLSAALPATLNQLVNLTSLQCESNRITGLIPNLSALTQLSILNFRNNVERTKFSEVEDSELFSIQL